MNNRKVSHNSSEALYVLSVPDLHFIFSFHARRCEEEVHPPKARVSFTPQVESSGEEAVAAVVANEASSRRRRRRRSLINAQGDHLALNWWRKGDAPV